MPIFTFKNTTPGNNDCAIEFEEASLAAAKARALTLTALHKADPFWCSLYIGRMAYGAEVGLANYPLPAFDTGAPVTDDPSREE